MRSLGAVTGRLLGSTSISQARARSRKLDDLAREVIADRGL